MNLKKLALILACSLASGMVVSACSEPIENETPCTQGTKACLDGNVKICYNGSWLDLEVCDATKPICDAVNFVCTNGITSACTDADNKCENGVLSRCNNGVLYNQVCANTQLVCGVDAAGQPACVPNQGQDPAPNCTPTCVNGVFTGCNADGSAMAPVNCSDSGKVCGEVGGVAACVEAEEPPAPSCTPTCVNDVFTGCDADGNALAAVKCSDSGKVCGEVSGVATCVEAEEPPAPSCTPTCVNDVFTGCDADGNALAAVKCSDSGKVCGEVSGVAACVEAEEPPVTTCTPTCVNDVFTGCDADGNALAAVNCSDSGAICGEVDGVAACVEAASGLVCPADAFFVCQTLNGKEWAVFCDDGQVWEEFTEECPEGSYCDEELYGCTEVLSCGDGVVDEAAGEQCDRDNLNGKTCAGVLGSYSATGTLKCTAGCSFDTSECVDYYCGNGVLEDYEIFGAPGEACDKNDFGGLTCTTYMNDGKTYKGSLACSEDCGIDASGCVAEEVVAPSTYTTIKSIRSNYNNIVSIDASNKCSVNASEASKSASVKGLVTAVKDSGNLKGTFYIQGDDATDNAAIPVYCKDACNVSVSKLADLKGKVVTVSGTGVFGLFGCGLQFVHQTSNPVSITVVTDTVNVTPKTLTISEIAPYTPSTPYAGMLLKVENVKLMEEGGKKYLTQGSDKMEPSNNFYTYAWTTGTTYSSVTGVLHYVAAGYFAPLSESDIVVAAPCVGKCEGGKYYACVDGTLSSTGTAQPTTSNGSYTCDVNNGWVLSCDGGYQLSADGTSCVEVSGGGGNTLSIDFTKACDATTHCSKSGSGYGTVRTYTIGSATVVATGNYDSSYPGVTLTGGTDNYEKAGIVVTGLAGVTSVSFSHAPWGNNGDMKGVVTVNSVVDEFDTSVAGTYTKSYNDTSASGLTIKSKKSSNAGNKYNRFTVSSLEITMP